MNNAVPILQTSVRFVVNLLMGREYILFTLHLYLYIWKMLLCKVTYSVLGVANGILYQSCLQEHDFIHAFKFQYTKMCTNINNALFKSN